MTASNVTLVEPYMSPEMFQAVLPKQMRSRVNPEVMDLINDALKNEFTRDQFTENILGFSTVLQEGRYKMTDYVNAVKYISYLVMGSTNQEAYAKTFPQRYQDLLIKGATAKEQSAYVSMYNKSKLVNLVRACAQTPTHILNAHVLQEAINTQRSIMKDPDVSPKVRSDAANSLMTHLKAPEDSKKVELEIGLKDTGELTELKDIMNKMAQLQHNQITGGFANPKDIAYQNILTINNDTGKVENGTD
jgi:hypothetical protein